MFIVWKLLNPEEIVPWIRRFSLQFSSFAKSNDSSLTKNETAIILCNSNFKHYYSLLTGVMPFFQLSLSSSKGKTSKIQIIWENKLWVLFIQKILCSHGSIKNMLHYEFVSAKKNKQPRRAHFTCTKTFKMEKTNYIHILVHSHTLSYTAREKIK